MIEIEEYCQEKLCKVSVFFIKYPYFVYFMLHLQLYSQFLVWRPQK